MMNTYPTTAEQLYMEQKIRDDNNPGCIAFRKSKELEEKFRPKTEKQKLLQEKGLEIFKEEQMLGYSSTRYNFPEYLWWMIEDNKKYYRSSSNFNVYDYESPSIIVGTWNKETQRIEFTDDLVKKIKRLEEEVASLKLNNN